MAPAFIGRYEIERELGRGGMAVVVIARDPLMKRQVAIKVLPRQFTFDPQFRLRFQHEAEIIASLEHAAIVPVYDYGEFEEQPYIVMRYMPGGSLAERLAPGKMEQAQAAVLVERIGSAIDYAHAHGVIHRDLKPGNILFDGQGNAYLSDFGIAKIAESTSAFTGTAILGTPEYMSPEQAQGNRNLDGRTDIYSLGVVLFYVLSGQLPYSADTPMGVAVAHIQQPVPDILAVEPSLPSAYRSILRKALAKNPDERYPTGADLAAAVRRMDGGDEDATQWVPPLAPATQIELPPLATLADQSVSARLASSSVDSQASFTPEKGNVTQSPAQPAPRRSRALIWALAGAALAVLCAVAALAGALGLLRRPAQLPSPTAPVAVVVPLPTQPPAPKNTQVVPITAPIGMQNASIEYVLDGSGSMNEVLESGKTKLEIARDVLSSRIATLPNGMQAGMRVFGTSIPWQNNKTASCKDIKLAIPIAPNGREKIAQWLPGFVAMGMTPIAESLRQAAGDFTFDSAHKNFVVLITDGEEDCGGDPVAQVRNLKELGIDFTIHVIGMSVDPNTRAQLSSIAQAAKGIYHDAHTEKDLRAALDDIHQNIVMASSVSQAVPPTQSPVAPKPENTSTAAPPVDIASEGKVKASSIYSAEYPESLVLDQDLSTSWFSAGPGPNGISTFTWTGQRDDTITKIMVISNRLNKVVAFRKNYGFGAVKVEVLDSAGNVQFSQDVSLPGTPDPDVTVTPNVQGRSVVLIFSNSEARDCGGFAELQIDASR